MSKSQPAKPAPKPAPKPAAKPSHTESHAYDFRTRNNLRRGPK